MRFPRAIGRLAVAAAIALLATLTVGNDVSRGQGPPGGPIHVEALSSGLYLGVDQAGNIILGWVLATPLQQDPTQVRSVDVYRTPPILPNCRGAHARVDMGADQQRRMIAALARWNDCTPSGLELIRALPVEEITLPDGDTMYFVRLPRDVADVASELGTAVIACEGEECTQGQVDFRSLAQTLAAALTCEGETVTIAGTVGDDVIRGTGSRDVVRTFGGDDVVDAGDGNDLVCLDEGFDSAAGGAGNDRILGGPGGDTIDGDAGNDTIRGGGGDDELDGNGGDDNLNGGAGDDELDGGRGKDTLRGKGGDDELNGGKGPDRLLGAAGNDSLSGQGGADVLKGGGGTDLLAGGAGGDELDGGRGSGDRVEGNSGSDRLIGGAGEVDDCIGGRGNDALGSQHGCEVVRSVP